MKDLKPSTRQRFVTIDFDFPTPDDEIEIVAARRAWRGRSQRAGQARRALRRLRDRGLVEVASTRLLVHAAARLIARGVSPGDACRTAVAAPLTDEADLLAAIHDVIAAVL